MKDSEYKCVSCGEVVEDHELGEPGTQTPPIHEDCELPEQDVPTTPTAADERIDPPPNEW